MLVAAVARGDREAAGVVWDRYSSQILGVLYGALGANQSVEDLLQEVFIAFVKGAKNIKDGSALRSYLIGVALRMAALEIRKIKIRR